MSKKRSKHNVKPTRRVIGQELNGRLIYEGKEIPTMQLIGSKYFIPRLREALAEANKVLGIKLKTEK